VEGRTTAQREMPYGPADDLWAAYNATPRWRWLRRERLFCRWQKAAAKAWGEFIRGCV
jgi:hypothetical protein